ncbi:MAG: sulfatase-like hydrolase/transferase [Verrucomicrobiota bacterium]
MSRNIRTPILNPIGPFTTWMILGILSWLPFASSQAKEPYNILWICAEDLSPFFGCYGHPEAITPQIDAFASESTLFEEALTTAPICAPSRSSLATGMYAHSLGTAHLRSSVEIPETIRPLARVFKENGYWTALTGKTDYNFSAEGLFEYAKWDRIPWRNCPEGKPFFAFLNLGKTHESTGNFVDRANTVTADLSPSERHDPERTVVPPYFPNTPEMRRLWARYHDIATVFDREFGDVMGQLERDGLAENTIVFLFADHGHGTPRYKRWLNHTGLHVPLIVRHPDKAAARVERPVSMIDLPATALDLAGIAVPDNYEGSPLNLDSTDDPKGTWPLFGARDRADDMYELSRLVYDGEYLYIRHFQPHLSPLQEGIIFSDRKDFFRELRRAHNAGLDTDFSRRLWDAKPVEELYHMPSDPQELRNLASDPNFSETKAQLAKQLKEHLLQIRDTSFLLEPELERRSRAAGLTRYELGQSKKHYDLDTILRAAWDAGERDLSHLLSQPDSAVRFWALQSGWIHREMAPTLLVPLLQDGNPHVEITAAGLLAETRDEVLERQAHDVFRRYLKADEPRLFLYNARTLALAPKGTASKLEPELRRAHRTLFNPDPNGKRPYRDFNYSSFAGWAIEWSFMKSGLPPIEK